MLDKKNWCIGKDFALQYENERFKFVATLALGFDQGKGVARLRAKRKPGSHITYSWECKKV
jgi:hypothetical protein